MTHELHFFATVKNDALQISERGLNSTVFGEAQTEGELNEIIQNAALNLFGLKPGDEIEVSFMCSSTVDFPAESTKNRRVIRLCKMLRG